MEVLKLSGGLGVDACELGALILSEELANHHTRKEAIELIWILLAALGVPLWLIVGALGGALWSRRQFQQAPGVFLCKVRIVSGPEGPGKWTRSTAHTRWVHDVLLVHVGLALVRFRALPVAAVDAPLASASDVKLKGGDDVVSVSLRLDDGSVVQIAGLRSAAGMLLGPFVDVRQITTDGGGA